MKWLTKLFGTVEPTLVGPTHFEQAQAEFKAAENQVHSYIVRGGEKELLAYLNGLENDQQTDYEIVSVGPVYLVEFTMKTIVQGE